MELIRYFKYYLHLTRGKVIYFIFLVLSSVGFQVLAGAAIVTVLNFETENLQKNRISAFVIKSLYYFNINNSREQFIILLVLALVTFYISTVCFIYCTWYTAKLQNKIFVELQREIMNALLNSQYEFFLSNSAGMLNNIIIQQVRRVAMSFKFFCTVLTNAIIAAAFMILPILMNLPLVVILCIFGLPLIFIIKNINNRTRTLSVESVEEFNKFSSTLLQTISNLKYLKATNSYPAILRKHEKYTTNLAAIFRKLALLGGVNEYGLLAYAVSYFIFMIYIEVVIMNTPIVGLISALGFIFYASRKLMVIPASYQKFLNVIGAIEAVEEFKIGLNLHREKFSGTREPDFSGTLKFENVSFQYQTSDTPAIYGISLEIKPKISVGIAGASGSGKSTFINLITALLSPTEGKILLGDTDYKDINIRKLRSAIAYVPQEPVIFNDTVLENIRLWNKNISEKQVKEAAKQSMAHEFIEAFPNKYNEILGDNGMNISGGQRQRITIARELLKGTPVLILDEATSALDSETESQIRKSIDSLQGKHTVIIVAHRLSTIKNCDIIFVFQKGRIIASGSYDKLYKSNDVFKKMVDAQNLEA